MFQSQRHDVHHRDDATDGRIRAAGGRLLLPSLPRSTILNFVALLMLFATLVLLQRISNRLDAMHATQAIAAPAGKAIASAPIVAKSTAPATIAVKATAPAAATVPIARETPKPVVYTLQPAAAAPAEIQTPRIDQQPPMHARRHGITTRGTTRTRWAADRAISVDELDSEVARQSYLNEGGAPTPAAAPLAIEAQPLPPPTIARPVPAHAISANASDLDSEAARLWYQEENQRLTAVANRSTVQSPREDATTATASTGTDFIPFEQPR
jgi:hypothetical protein